MVIKPQIRLFSPDDLPSAVRIEKHNFEFPWDSVEFMEYIGDSKKKSYTAKYKDHLLGYLAYELIDSRDYIRIRNISIDSNLHKIGIGRALLDYIEEEYRPNKKYKSLVATVRETNLDGQLFFKSMGFICTKILHGYYIFKDVAEPAYLMKKKLR